MKTIEKFWGKFLGISKMDKKNVQKSKKAKQSCEKFFDETIIEIYRVVTKKKFSFCYHNFFLTNYRIYACLILLPNMATKIKQNPSTEYYEKTDYHNSCYYTPMC